MEIRKIYLSSCWLLFLSFLSTERIGCRQQDGDDVATHARLFINEIPARKEFIYHILITIYSRRFLFLVMGRIKESDSTLHLFREVDRARDLNVEE